MQSLKDLIDACGILLYIVFKKHYPEVRQEVIIEKCSQILSGVGRSYKWHNSMFTSKEGKEKKIYKDSNKNRNEIGEGITHSGFLWNKKNEALADDVSILGLLLYGYLDNKALNYIRTLSPLTDELKQHLLSIPNRILSDKAEGDEGDLAFAKGKDKERFLCTYLLKECEEFNKQELAEIQSSIFDRIVAKLPDKKIEYLKDDYLLRVP